MTFPVYASYTDFVEDLVLPRRAENPSARRLDGLATGGNWAVAAVFEYDGREWKVHEDSHFEPLLLAYEAVRSGDSTPFVEEPRKAGTSLNLEPELRARLSDHQHKYIYIYSV